MERTIQEIKDNTTFVISGHNIKWFGVLAVESLIARCDVKREQIVFFDDFSTDGTAEEMHRRGIKTISWDEETYKSFINSQFKEDPPVRVSQIIKSSILQTKTEYMCALDGDIIHVENTISNILSYITASPLFNKDEFSVFGAIKTKGPTKPFDDLGTHLYQGVLYLNVALLKECGITGESLTELETLITKYGPLVFHKYYDTGTSLYNEIKRKEVQLIHIDYLTDKFDELCGFHLGSVSSLMRKDQYSGQSFNNGINHIVHVFSFDEVKNACEEFNVDINILFRTTLDNLRQSSSV